MSKLVFKPWSFDLLSSIESDKFIYIVDDALNLTLPSEASIFNCQAGEDLKTFSKLEEAINFFLSVGITRNTHLVAIGGGSVSDFAGLVASLLLRGIHWSVVPTTLLSMIDAAIGGKTAINTSHGKNLVGTFHLPDSIFIDISFLKTLDQSELDSGKGEVLKYCFLEESVYQNVIKKNFSWEDVVTACAYYKSRVVSEDLLEGGQRKLLNLGHTFGHAIEKLNKIPHGLAVVYGLQIVIELYGTEKSKKLFYEIKQALGFKKLNLKEVSLDTDEIFNYIKNDKKNIGNDSIALIIPKDSGASVIEVKAIDQIEEDFKTFQRQELE